ncbi:MAG: hypothetical protein K1X39_09970 [Thermoflexales bacterium]|nr:hypothetical protein [Thermoflexales bacterium]
MNQVVVKRKYSSLRFIGSLMKVFAWISLILGVFALVGSVLGAATNSVRVNVWQPEAASALNTMGLSQSLVNLILVGLGGLGAILGGIFAYLAFMAAGDQIHVMVDTEHNTRAMVELMTRLVTLQTPLPTPPVTSAPAVAISEPGN